MDNNRLLIVTYHYIGDPTQYPRGGIHPLPRSTFESHIQNISRSYYIPTPLEVEAFLYKDYAFEKPSVFFTFDDGLIDHYLVATTLLAEYNICGAFFISTEPLIKHSVLTVHKAQWLRAHCEPNFLRNEFYSLAERAKSDINIDDCRKQASKHYRFDNPQDAHMKYLINFILPPGIIDHILTTILERTGTNEKELSKKLYMNEEQILELHNSGHLIGAHSHRHIPLRRLDNSLDKDIKTNIEVISNVIGYKPTWISYPHGTTQTLPINPVKFCECFGLRIGLTMEPGWNLSNTPPTQLRRIEQNDIGNFIEQELSA